MVVRAYLTVDVVKESMVTTFRLASQGKADKTIVEKLLKEQLQKVSILPYNYTFLAYIYTRILLTETLKYSIFLLHNNYVRRGCQK